MKQLFRILAATILLLSVGCIDDDLYNRLDNLEERVSKLEELCREMNTNISSLQTIVTALQTNDYVTAVTPIVEDGKTVGYTISFVKSDPITIYHGKDGKDGVDGEDGKDGQDGKDGVDGYTPVIGVRQDSDGIYYWTLDGDWLLDDNGNKIKAQGIDGKDGQDGKDGEKGEQGEPGVPGQNGADGKDGQDGKDGEKGEQGEPGAPGQNGADGKDGQDGADGITPQLKIEGEYWYISYDNGASWTRLGKATGEDGTDGQNGQDGKDGKDGDSFFKSVTQDEENVYFELADGTVITLPKGTALNITFEESDLVVMSPRSTRSIGYTVSSMTDKVTVEVTSSADIKAKVIPADNSGMAGSIQVITGDSIDEYSKVIVFVSNGDKVIMRSITFEETGLAVVDNATKQAPAEGGEVVLEFLTNVKCEASIPEEAQDWISVVPATRALEKQTITLKLEPNEGAARSAEIEVKSIGGELSLTYTVSQDANTNYQLVLEREALIAIYNALDGDNWENNENWCSDKPVNEWNGVVCGENNLVKYLDLSQSTVPMRGKIPAEIGNLSHLKYINIWLYTNEGLPEEIGNCKELETVIIAINTDKRMEFPMGLYDCINLKNIRISGAGLEGVLSSKIGQLKNLQNLDLGGNYISGPLPEEIGELVNLERLDIRGLGHIGELPHSIGNLKNLKTISLCHMSGDLPKELGQLSNLEDLLFFSEYPITSIPDDIYNVTTLKRLELSFTQFPYTIPDAIGNLTELESLVIDYDLSGTIPETIGKLTKLKRLSLSNPFPQGGESLRGDVPKSLQSLEYWPYFWADVISGHPYLNTKDLNLPAMHIHAEDLDGNGINTDEIYSKNQLTIIYSWDGICPSVTELHPILKDLYSKYHEKGFDVVGYVGGSYEDYIKELVHRFEIPWRNFSGTHFPFKNGAAMAPGYITGLAIVVNSSGQIVYETMTGDYNGLKKYVEKVFNSDIQLYESSNYSADGKIKTLQTATKGDGIDIVLMGDAYSDRQIADGTYEADMKNLYNNLFTEEPYRSFKDHFNVYYVNVVSKNEGYSTYNETALSGYFGDGTLVGGNDKAVFDYALKAISEDEMDEALLIVAMNSDNYAGTCYMYYPDNNAGCGNGVSVSYFPRGGDATTFAQLLHHEACGHGFAKLADEYAYDYMGTIPDSDVNAYKAEQAVWGWWKNVDFTNNLSQIRWSSFLNDSRYQYDGLGAYEGGLTYWSGVWRPSENSIMRYNTGGFNAPSREAIYYHIHKLAYGDSWQYDYEEFVEWDARNRKTEADAHKAPYRAPANFKHTAPPVVVNKSWKDAK